MDVAVGSLPERVLAEPAVTLDDVRAAAARIRGRVLRTPSIRSEAIDQATGAAVTLKLDTLQAVGSFKERGAANRLALLDADERARGVVAMSAGNHAQGVARHAALLGIRAVIVMPSFTPLAKVSRTAGYGAEVVLHGDTLAESSAHAHTLAAAQGLVFIHPYDDLAIIAGQGTLALELLEDAPNLDMLVVPIGGGGLIAGCAAAAKGLNPATEIIGVQVASHASLVAMPIAGGSTIAEGIAVGQTGVLTRPLIRRHVSEVLVAPEESVEAAVVLLAEGAKLVAEGAGAAALAGMLAHPERFRGRRVGVPVCGANIDARILANVLMRGLLRDGRLLRLRMEIPDRPGVLADIATIIGRSGGNIIEVQHQRLRAVPSVQAAVLEVMVEARDQLHAQSIETALMARYVVQRG